MQPRSDAFPSSALSAGCCGSAASVALTVGDVVGDTLYVHIEKASRAFEGAYEAINALFAASFGDEVVYVNREEDLGLEGLRQAKEGYCPERMIHKFLLMPE